MQLPIDVYTFRARLAPALLSVLPVGLTIIAVYSDSMSWWTPFWTVITAFGGMFLVAEIGRDAGKKKEAALFDRWGGKPTTQRLRYRSVPNREILIRYQQLISEIAPSIQFPTEEEEIEHPDKADDIYEAAVNTLRERTRDRAEFALLFQALCEYGFRRNLWGLKPLGLVLSLTATIATGLAWTTAFAGGPFSASPTLALTCVLNALLLAIWIARIRPDWVKIAAFSYADRLLAATEHLRSNLSA